MIVATVAGVVAAVPAAAVVVVAAVAAAAVATAIAAAIARARIHILQIDRSSRNTFHLARDPTRGRAFYSCGVWCTYSRRSMWSCAVRTPEGTFIRV